MTKQIPTSFVYAMDDFISFTANTLEEITLPFYKRKDSSYPIDEPVKAMNAFYSTILFCLSREVTPRQDDIEACGIKSIQPIEYLYMRALDIYDLWRQSGLECAVTLYCNKINDIVARTAANKAQGYALIGDLTKKKREIFDALCKEDNRILVRNLSDRTFVL